MKKLGYFLYDHIGITVIGLAVIGMLIYAFTRQ